MRQGAFRGWQSQIRDNWKGLLLIASFIWVSILGGGSRADIDSLIILRPVCAFLFVTGLFCLTMDQYRRYKPVLLFSGAILATISFQLVPLPPGIWGALPGHEPFVEAAELVGLSDAWRPASLYPALTWNAFFAALVPFSLLLLFAASNAQWRHNWMLSVLAFGFLSAILGVFQIGGPPNGPLYFYDITNGGSAVGFFANRNHNGVLMALMPPLIIYAVLTIKFRSKAGLAVAGAILWFVFLLMVLIIGSRLGLLLFTLSSLASSIMLPKESRASLPMPTAFKQSAAFIYPVVVPILIVLAAVLATNNEATERLLVTSPDGELRTQIVPVVLNMIGDFWPIGGGGGTFPMTYYLYESTEFLGPTYLNHVHNDWLEIAYAYGLAGMVLIVVAVAFVIRYAFIGWNAKIALKERLAVRTAIVSVVILFIGSITDYPLRTPSLATIAIIMAAILVSQSGQRRSPI